MVSKLLDTRLIPASNPVKVRENFLKTVEMRNPDWIPCKITFSQATWSRYREKLEQLLLKHPILFPGFRRGKIRFDDFGLRRRGSSFVDCWGCRWVFSADGLQGQVVEHPLEEWSRLEDFSTPNPEDGIPVEGGPTVNWDSVEASVRKAREKGGLTPVFMPHGFLFQRLYYLRGFINLMKDMVSEPPQLYRLLDMLVDYYLELVERIVKLKPDIVYFGDDLGLQDRMPISPARFRKIMYPAYKRIFTPLREAGIHVYLHSDGHIIEVAGMLIDSGVSVLNLQDRVNGLEAIAETCKGRVCVDLDIDRQKLLPFQSPVEVRSHLKNAVEKLASRRGGFMMKADVYPDVPLENIEALCKAMEEFIQLHLTLD